MTAFAKAAEPAELDAAVDLPPNPPAAAAELPVDEPVVEEPAAEEPQAEETAAISPASPRTSHGRACAVHWIHPAGVLGADTMCI